MDTAEKQAAAETTTTASHRQAPDTASGSPASKLPKVADGDKASAAGTTEGEVKIARCSQEYIDALLRLEKNPIRPFRIPDSLEEGYTGSIDFHGIVRRANEAKQRMDDAHASILEQYRTLGVAYTEVVAVRGDELHRRRHGHHPEQADDSIKHTT